MQFKRLSSLAEHSDVYRDSRRMAIIDMGSNSFRLIVIEYVPHLSFKIVDEVREAVRLSGGMGDEDILQPEAMDRAVRVAQIYSAFCASTGIQDIVAVGTSAIRDAHNRAYFLKRVQNEAHIPVRVLSGEEEAYYGYLAAVNSTTLEDGFVLDMGGGSLQITQVRERQRVQSVSFPLGAVRMTEAFLHSDPVTPKELQRLQAHIQEQLAPYTWFKAGDVPIVFEGGNVRLIGRLVQKREHHPLDSLHGYYVSQAQVDATRDELLRLPTRARQPR